MAFWCAGVSLEKLEVVAQIVDLQPLELPFPYFRVLLGSKQDKELVPESLGSSMALNFLK